jgi:hypothetical protein
MRMTLPDAPRTMLSAACVVMLALCASCASITERPQPALKVMAFNVRLPTDADGAHRWDARRDIAVRMLREADADLIGTQELHRRQGDEIAAALPQHRWFGRGRDADRSARLLRARIDDQVRHREGDRHREQEQFGGGDGMRHARRFGGPEWAAGLSMNGRSRRLLGRASIGGWKGGACPRRTRRARKKSGEELEAGSRRLGSRR